MTIMYHETDISYDFHSFDIHLFESKRDENRIYCYFAIITNNNYFYLI